LPQTVQLDSKRNQFLKKKKNQFSRAAWSSGIVSACGVMGRKIESRQGVVWLLERINHKLKMRCFFTLSIVGRYNPFIIWWDFNFQLKIE
jgi:hypothetical protein